MTAWQLDAVHVRVRALVTLVLGSQVAACGGGERRQTADRAADTVVGVAPSVDTGATIGGSAITPPLIALGDSIFKGQAAGGICYTCHGQDAKGTTLAPNLTDSEWLNGDGSLQFIANTVRTGVPQPKQHPAPMPPFGQILTPEQVNAVAAYVSSLTHPRN